MGEQRALVVLLGSRDATRPIAAALASATGARLVRVEYAESATTVCVALTLAHRVPIASLRTAVGVWARRRGWREAIAPLTGPA